MSLLYQEIRHTPYNNAIIHVSWYNGLFRTMISLTNYEKNDEVAIKRSHSKIKSTTLPTRFMFLFLKFHFQNTKKK